MSKKGGMRAPDVLRAVLKLLGEGPLVQRELRERTSAATLGESEKHYGEIFATLRKLMLVDVNEAESVSLSWLGEYVTSHPEMPTADELMTLARQWSPRSPLTSVPKAESFARSLKALLTRLPKMTPQEIANVRFNAHRKLDQSAHPAWRFAALVTLAAIRGFWARQSNELDDDNWFQWPSTDAPGGRGQVDHEVMQPDGMLSYMGYRVGVTNGEDVTIRRHILTEVFEHTLPPVFSRAYMDEWSTVKSAARLRKMANSIAQFAKNIKRRHDSSFDVAIEDWESDLAYLYDKYYVDHFHFDWPSTRMD
ncbi:MAG: hypothetical protein K8F58_01170 [Bauldia sp.]|nr:hypothetical protein [Bauldia sp.]